jgi:hypothetical protein
LVVRCRYVCARGPRILIEPRLNRTADQCTCSEGKREPAAKPQATEEAALSLVSELTDKTEHPSADATQGGRKL